MAEEKTAEQIKAEMDKAAEEAAKLLKKLDKAAEEAAKLLKKLDKAAVKVVAEWMKANLATAGYKRLGKALVATLGTAKKTAE